MFYFFVFLMMIVTGTFVLAPLIRRSPARVDRRDINLLVFEEQLKEIDDERPANASQLRSELKRELLASAAEKDLPIIETNSGRGSLIFLSILSSSPPGNP